MLLTLYDVKLNKMQEPSVLKWSYLLPIHSFSVPTSICNEDGYIIINPSSVESIPLDLIPLAVVSINTQYKIKCLIELRKNPLENQQRGQASA